MIGQVGALDAFCRVHGKMIADDGTVIDLKAHTLCVHGDTPTALDLVRSISEILSKNGMEIIPIDTMFSS